jgi:hypothetical protein
MHVYVHMGTDISAQLVTSMFNAEKNEDTDNVETLIRGSSVGIATGCRAGVRFLAGARGFSFLCSVQTCSGAHPESYQRGTGGSLDGG